MQYAQILEKPRIDDKNVTHVGLAGCWSRIFGAFGTWWHRRRLMRELEALPDRLLADAGIERHEIAVHADHAARQLMRR